MSIRKVVGLLRKSVLHFYMLGPNAELSGAPTCNAKGVMHKYISFLRNQTGKVQVGDKQILKTRIFRQGQMFDF
jgi:hypothetical protein